MSLIVLSKEMFDNLVRGCKQSFEILNDPRHVPEYLLTDYVKEVLEDLNITIDKTEKRLGVTILQ